MEEELSSLSNVIEKTLRFVISAPEHEGYIEPSTIADEIAQRIQEVGYKLNAPRKKALRAIQARIQGEWDNPALMEFGPLGTNVIEDILAIISETE